MEEVVISVEEKLCEKVAEIRRKSDGVMAMILVFQEEAMRVVWAIWAIDAGEIAFAKD